MKELRLTFTDEEHYELLKKKKEKESWHDYILRASRGLKK